MMFEAITCKAEWTLDFLKSRNAAEREHSGKEFHIHIERRGQWCEEKDDVFDAGETVRVVVACNGAPFLHLFGWCWRKRNP